ncbi:MAG: hypothetical protein PVH59_13340, partial [Anaerolineae bacterium]
GAATHQTTTLAPLPISARAGPQSSTPGGNARTVVRAEPEMNVAVSLVDLARLWPQAQRRNPQLPKWRLRLSRARGWRPKAGRLAVTGSVSLVVGRRFGTSYPVIFAHVAAGLVGLLRDDVTHQITSHADRPIFAPWSQAAGLR